MEQCSETSERSVPKLRNIKFRHWESPTKRIQHSQHGKSLKSRKVYEIPYWNLLPQLLVMQYEVMLSDVRRVQLPLHLSFVTHKPRRFHTKRVHAYIFSLLGSTALWYPRTSVYRRPHLSVHHLLSPSFNLHPPQILFTIFHPPQSRSFHSSSCLPFTLKYFLHYHSKIHSY